MAAADQIKSLIKSFGDGDDSRFFATAMQIAASEARKGHTTFARDLQKMIEKARKGRSIPSSDRGRTIALSQPKRELNELIEVFQPDIRLDDMILAPEIRKSLDRIILEQKKTDLLQHHNLTPRRKILLTGPPRCGKTMTAQALAGELHLPVLIVRLDGLISKFMGESIAKLRLIFDAMVDLRGVYLFDEFDSIGSHRYQGQDVGEIKRVLNSFLINIEKDPSHSLIIAATNLPEALDHALFRRFDDIITFPRPSKNEIKQVLKKHLHRCDLSDFHPWDRWVREAQGLSYAEIVRACEEALKEMILTGSSTVNTTTLSDTLQKRQR